MAAISMHGDEIARFINRAVAGVPVDRLAREFQLMPVQVRQVMAVYRDTIEQMRNGSNPPAWRAGPEPEPEKKRKCLDCRSDFTPAHRGLLICRRCKATESHRYGELVAV